MKPNDYERAIVTISKEALSELPAADYPGKIVIVNDQQGLSAALSVLHNASVVGFDTETRPSFKKGQLFDVALVQLATPEYCYLIRTNKIGFPKELIEFLEDPSIVKVGLSIHDDFHSIRRNTDIKPGGFVDLQPYVKEFKIADNSLSRLYGILFGKRISKGQRLSNWECEELSEAQQAYAALDAYACIKIYDYLKGGRFNPKESPYLTLPPEPEEKIAKEE